MKESASFSWQLTPTYIHRNTVRIQEDPHDIFALGFGSRVKISNRVSLNGEYYHAFNESTSINARNSLAFGVDIETGGHVFQMHFTNAQAMNANGYLGQASGDWTEGNIYFGFNLSRVF